MIFSNVYKYVTVVWPYDCTYIYAFVYIILYKPTNEQTYTHTGRRGHMHRHVLALYGKLDDK